MSSLSKIKNDIKSGDGGSNKLSTSELEFLLKMISETAFKGKDVQIVYDTVVKLQNSILDLQNK